MGLERWAPLFYSRNNCNTSALVVTERPDHDDVLWAAAAASSARDFDSEPNAVCRFVT